MAKDGFRECALQRGGRLTRHKGKVATIAPALLALVAGAALVLDGAPAAQAGNCVVAGNDAFCSGAPDAATDTTQTINFTNAGPATITFDAGAGIDTGTSGGGALDVTAGADVTGLTVSEPSGPAAGLIGEGRAFHLDYNGSGQVDVTLSGTVQSGNGQNALDFYIGPSAAAGSVADVNMDFTNATINGAAEGIHATIENSGDALFDTGAVRGTGTGEEGIHIRKLGSGDVVLNANDIVSGVSEAIEVTQEGQGALLVSAIDLYASGGSGKGVEAIVTTNAGTDLGVIVNGNIEAGGTGVLADNSGSGFTAVWASGSITGIGGPGNAVAADGIRVRTGTGSGVAPLPLGTLPFLANVYVLTDAGATGVIEASDDGIDVIHDGVGTVLIDSETPIVAGDRGIDLQVTNANAGNATVDVTGGITAGDRAISVDHRGRGVATVDVSNATLTTNTGHGISLATGTAGTDANAWLSNARINAATARGIHVEHGGTGTTNVAVDANSSITAGNDGVFANATNADAGRLSVTIKGQVNAANSGVVGITAGKDDAIITTTAQITANGNGTGDVGVGVRHSGSSGNITITTNALVDFNGTGAGEVAIGAERTSGAAADGDATITSNAEVQSDAHGIVVNMGNTISGNATINQNQALYAAYSGVFITHRGAGNATINASTVVANGNASDDVGIGVDHFGRGNIDISANGDVTFNGTGAGESAVSAAHAGNGNVNVLTEGAVTSGSNGISAYLAGDGDVSVQAQQSITAALTGIGVGHGGNGNVSISANGITAGGTGVAVGRMAGAGDISLQLRGRVSAGDIGVVVSNFANAGNISVTAIDSIEATAGSGITVESTSAGSVGITHHGSITAGLVGIEADTGEDSTTSTISMLGSIDAQDAGVRADHRGSGPLTILVQGDVKSATDVGIDTYTKAAGLTRLRIDSGETTGPVAAIRNNKGDSIIDIAASATIRGDITLGDGTDKLTFNGGDLSGITLFDGGDDTATGDGWVDELTLSGVTLTANGGIFQNWEVFSLINGSTLNASSGTIGAGSMHIGAGSILNFADGAGGGALVLAGDLDNEGTVTSQDGVAGDTLAINGDYGGNGAVRLDTRLDDGATDTTDKLLIQGDNNGSIVVNVQNAGGPGAYTGDGPTDGIRVVEVQGANNGTLSLANGPLVAGAFIYDLTNDGYLQSKPAASAMSMAMAQLLMPTTMESLWERTSSSWAASSAAIGGSTQAAGYTVTPTAATPVDMIAGLWLRGRFRHNRADADLTVAGAPFAGSMKSNRVWVQMGYTHNLVNGAAGVLAGSIFGQYKHTSMTFRSPGINDINSSAKAFGGGASLTWLGADGLYGDLHGEINRHRLSITDTVIAASGKTWMTTWQLGIEGGWRLPVADGVNLIPQAQLNITGSRTQGISIGALNYAGGSHTWATGRLGLGLELFNLSLGSEAEMTAQFTASVLHDFTTRVSSTVAGQPVSAEMASTRAELRSSITIQDATSGLSFFLENSLQHSLTGPKQHALRASAGVKLSF